jgi:uncharacterized protein YndB with AHSA1/START domain
MADAFQIEMVVPGEPQRVFNAWMDSREHALFTGGGEAIVEPWAGGRFTSFDGYIHGIFLGVDTGKRIVQTWRTVEFTQESRDSRVVVEFEAVRGGTRVRVRHTDVPPSQLKKYERGWSDHYLKPLQRYFAKGGKQAAAATKLTGSETTWGRHGDRKEPARKVAPARKASAAKKVSGARARKPALRKAPRRAAPARKKPAARRKR